MASFPCRRKPENQEARAKLADQGHYLKRKKPRHENDTWIQDELGAEGSERHNIPSTQTKKQTPRKPGAELEQECNRQTREEIRS